MDPLLNMILRHQVYLEGLKTGKNDEFFAVIAKLNVALKRDLAFVSFDDLGDMTKRQLNELLATLKKTAKSVFDAYLSDVIKWLEGYMHVDYEFWKFAYGLMEGVNPNNLDEVDDEKQTWSAIGLMPMGANGILWRTFLSAAGILGTTKITQLVTQHWANNSKKQELMDALFGTKANKLNDGLLAKLAQQGNAASNTVIQHIAANVNATVAEALWDQYQWISVLDNGTTEICRNRAWLIWAYGKGPIPPAHVGCRSSVIPVTARGPLRDMPSYTMWARAQSEAFKEDAFDGKPGKRYAGSKPLTLEEFAGKRSFIVG